MVYFILLAHTYFLSCVSLIGEPSLRTGKSHCLEYRLALFVLSALALYLNLVGTLMPSMTRLTPWILLRLTTFLQFFVRVTIQLQKQLLNGWWLLPQAGFTSQCKCQLRHNIPGISVLWVVSQLMQHTSSKLTLQRAVSQKPVPRHL